MMIADEGRSAMRDENREVKTTEDGYVVCQGVLGKSCFENFEKEKGCRLGRSLSFPFC